MAKHIRNIIIVISVLLLVATMWVPASATQTAEKPSAFSGQQNEMLVIGEMKKYYEAQASYHRTWVGWFGLTADLRDAGLIDAALASGEKFGYIFTFQRIMHSSTAPGRFNIKARPKIYGRTGTRSFYMSNTCIITGSDRSGEDAGPADPVIDTCTPTIARDWDEYALQGIRAIAAAQFTYQATTGAGAFGTHDQLLDANLLINPFGPRNNSLWYRAWTVSPGVRRGRPKFRARSTPSFYRETGIKSYFVDESGVIRGADKQGAPADEYDPPVDLSAQNEVPVNEHVTFFLIANMYGAQRMYFPGPQTDNYGDLVQLRQALIFSVPFEVNRFRGYIYTLTITPASDPLVPHYEFSAVPEIYGVTGVRSFYGDETGRIRGGDKGGAAANQNDPQILYF
jgi:hypothetical protein